MWAATGSEIIDWSIAIRSAVPRVGKLGDGVFCAQVARGDTCVGERDQEFDAPSTRWPVTLHRAIEAGMGNEVGARPHDRRPVVGGISHQLPPCLGTAAGSAETDDRVSQLTAGYLRTVAREGARGLGAIRALVDGAIQRAAFELLPISAKHAIEAGRLASPHRDPCDRMLSAQSRLKRIPLFTDDLGDEGDSLRSTPVRCMPPGR
jgi:hypothetical protein